MKLIDNFPNQNCLNNVIFVWVPCHVLPCHGMDIYKIKILSMYQCLWSGWCSPTTSRAAWAGDVSCPWCRGSMSIELYPQYLWRRYGHRLLVPIPVLPLAGFFDRTRGESHGKPWVTVNHDWQKPLTLSKRQQRWDIHMIRRQGLRLKLSWEQSEVLSPETVNKRPNWGHLFSWLTLKRRQGGLFLPIQSLDETSGKLGLKTLGIQNPGLLVVC